MGPCQQEDGGKSLGFCLAILEEMLSSEELDSISLRMERQEAEEFLEEESSGQAFGRIRVRID